MDMVTEICNGPARIAALGDGVKTVLVVAAALINERGEVLLAQRPEGRDMAGLWEFPGGKTEAGEIPEHALVRELHEELCIDVRPMDLEPVTFASHSYKHFHLLMPLYACRCWQGTLHGADGQAFQWVLPADLDAWSMPAADIPLIKSIRSYLRA